MVVISFNPYMYDRWMIYPAALALIAVVGICRAIQEG